jgi:hypothetical protein
MSATNEDLEDDNSEESLSLVEKWAGSLIGFAIFYVVLGGSPVRALLIIIIGGILYLTDAKGFTSIMSDKEE